MEVTEQISPQERVLIIQAYRNLLRVCRGVLNNEDVEQIRKAIDMAFTRGNNFRRPSGNLSVVHSLNVGRIVVEEIGLGRTSLICTLLYDLIQHSDIKLEEIANMFDEHVANIIKGLMKVAELYSKNAAIHTDNFRKLLLTFAQDVRVILIIIADRLQTIRTLDKYDKENQEKISSEVAYLYAPMAHRLGIYNIKSEMEDLVLKYQNREIYDLIARKLNETKRDRDRFIQGFIDPLQKELKQENLNFELKGRTKSIHSIWNKMRKQGVDFEHVYDLFAIRVILDSAIKDEKAECWKVYSIVTDKYQPNPSRMRDWLSIPKSNGYESLHSTVLGPENKWVEVQIRTRRMNEIAEKGLAAHWKYKGIKSEKGMDEWLSGIREILENPELNAVDFIDDFKLNLYDEEVFVFTPKGDLRRLPKGATVLDFAFDIHSNIGSQCVGAKVNQRNVPIKHELKNGDTVEIQTSKVQAPKRNWLSIVVTSRAKTKLKQALKEIEYKEAEIGKEMLMRRMKNWKLEMNDAVHHQLIKRFRYKTMHDFYRDIGLDKLDVAEIKDYLLSFDKKEEKTAEDISNLKKAENFVAAKEESEVVDTDVLLIDHTLKNVDYKLAKCCNPIFGDEIFGFVSATGGFKIHRDTCPNAADIKTRFGYRIVSAKWSTSGSSSYPAILKIMGGDDIGVVSNISQVISKENQVKMRSISVDSNEGTFEGTLTVFVNNINVLDGLIKKIKNVKGVYSVSRIDSSN